MADRIVRNNSEHPKDDPEGVEGRKPGIRAREACSVFKQTGKLQKDINVKEFGEMSEWLKEHAWKVCVRQRTEGSNPSLSANIK